MPISPTVAAHGQLTGRLARQRTEGAASHVSLQARLLVTCEAAFVVGCPMADVVNLVSAGKRRRLQRKRSESQKVQWLVGVMQATQSHHTNTGPRLGDILDTVTALRADVQRLQSRLAAVEGELKPATSVPVEKDDKEGPTEGVADEEDAGEGVKVWVQLEASIVRLPQRVEAMKGGYQASR